MAGKEHPQMEVDFAALLGAIQEAQTKFAGQLGSLMSRALYEAKKLAPVGWDRENRLPGGAKTKKPNGYRGGGHREGLVYEWDASKMEGNIHSEDGYGGYLHVGTSKMAARPDIVPGFMKAFEAFKTRAQNSAGGE